MIQLHVGYKRPTSDSKAKWTGCLKTEKDMYKSNQMKSWSNYTNIRQNKPSDKNCY